MSKFTSYCVLSGAALAIAAAAAPVARGAEVIYSFDDGMLNGFTANQRSVTVSTSTTTGVVSAPDALEIAASTTQTFGDATTATLPADFLTAPSFTVSVADGTPETSTYYDVQFIFFDTDGTLTNSNFINLGATTSSATMSYTLTNNTYSDPDGGTPGTPAQVLAEDTAFDAANGFPAPTLNSFGIVVDHGTGVATTTYFDNLTVPSAAVPEPASLGIIGMAGLTLVGRRRRHQRA